MGREPATVTALPVLVGAAPIGALSLAVRSMRWRARLVAPLEPAGRRVAATARRRQAVVVPVPEVVGSRCLVAVVGLLQVGAGRRLRAVGGRLRVAVGASPKLRPSAP